MNHASDGVLCMIQKQRFDVVVSLHINLLPRCRILQYYINRSGRTKSKEALTYQGKKKRQSFIHPHFLPSNHHHSSPSSTLASLHETHHFPSFGYPSPSRIGDRRCSLRTWARVESFLFRCFLKNEKDKEKACHVIKIALFFSVVNIFYFCAISFMCQLKTTAQILGRSLFGKKSMRRQISCPFAFVPLFWRKGTRT